MGPAWLGAALHFLLRRINYNSRGVAVADLTLSADLLKAMAARREVFEDRARDAVLDLHPRGGPPGMFAAAGPSPMF